MTVTKKEKELVLEYIREGIDTIPKMATAHFGRRFSTSWQRERDTNYIRRIVYVLRDNGQLRQCGHAKDRRIVVWEAVE